MGVLGLIFAQARREFHPSKGIPAQAKITLEIKDFLDHFHLSERIFTQDGIFLLKLKNIYFFSSFILFFIIFFFFM